MAYVADHLSVTALEERYEACDDVTSRPLAKRGHHGNFDPVRTKVSRWLYRIDGGIREDAG
jgi:hypothetical protein